MKPQKFTKDLLMPEDFNIHELQKLKLRIDI